MLDRRIRIATFNVHHGVGRDRRLDLRRTANVIGRLEADVIALQEIDRGLARSDRVDQVAELEALSGYRIYFHAALAIDEGEYGIALATRDDIETRADALPRVGIEEPRIAVSTKWRGVSVLATHLSRDRRARRVQVAALASLAADLTPPVLVLGDLNERAPRLGPLTDMGFVPALEPPVQRAWRTRSQIDHVLAGPGLRIVDTARPASDASDHLPLVAEIAV